MATLEITIEITAQQEKDCCAAGASDMADFITDGLKRLFPGMAVKELGFAGYFYQIKEKP